MSFFVKSTDPPSPKTRNVRAICLLLAAILIIMVVAQLFTFENFPAVIQQMKLPGSEIFAPVWVAVIVILEVAALPFLLFMRLSPAARILSMVAGWLVVTVWTFASVWVNTMVDITVNGGFLGATVVLTSGWWMVFFSLALGVLATWAAWGMWPLGRKPIN